MKESAMCPDGSCFTDHDVHRVLEKAGCYRFAGSEWFECTLEEVEQAIFAVKNRKLDMSKRIADFPMRPEQEKAVELIDKEMEKLDVKLIARYCILSNRAY